MEGTKREVVALYDVKDYSDITVTLSDGEVYVQKCVLVAFCEHFKTMLLGPWADQNIKGEHSDPTSEKKMLDMTSYNPRAYRAFLKYVYTGRLDLTEGEDLIDLYDISKSYLEDELTAMCSEMFVNTIKIDNLARFYEKASVNASEELLRHLVEFASKNLDQVVMFKDFENLESNLAKKLVVNAIRLSAEKKKNQSMHRYCRTCGRGHW